MFPPHFSLLMSWEVQVGKTLVCFQLLWEGSVFLLYNLQTYGILYMEMYESSSVGRDGLVFLSLNIILSLIRPILNLWINWKIIVCFGYRPFFFFFFKRVIHISNSCQLPVSVNNNMNMMHFCCAHTFVHLMFFLFVYSNLDHWNVFTDVCLGKKRTEHMSLNYIPIGVLHRLWWA